MNEKTIHRSGRKLNRISRTFCFGSAAHLACLALDPKTAPHAACPSSHTIPHHHLHHLSIFTLQIHTDLFNRSLHRPGSLHVPHASPASQAHRTLDQT